MGYVTTDLELRREEENTMAQYSQPQWCNEGKRSVGEGWEFSFGNLCAWCWQYLHHVSSTPALGWSWDQSTRGSAAWGG